MNRIHHTLLLALAAAAFPAALAAQPFRSDVTGPIPTGSGIAGMGYPVLPTRDIEGALFRRVSGRTAFRSRAIADAVLAEAAAAHQEACSGTMKPPRHWPDFAAFSVPGDVQRAACSMLGRPDEPPLRRFVNALGGAGQANPAEDPAERLVSALSGLGYLELSFLDGRQRFVSGGRWEVAFRAYDRYLDWAPAEVLDPPPPELVAIAAILKRLVDAGMAASER